jgi:peptidoglycan hydrolase-like protein with peptidoglycan-binding domain
MNRATIQSSLLSAAVAAILFTGAAHAADPATPASAAAQRAEMRTVGQVYASPSQVMLIQDKLREAGATVGTKGEWDSATQAAVRSFQQSHNLAPTGQLDTSLLSALDIGDVLEGQNGSGRFLDGLLRGDKQSTNTMLRGTPIYVSPVHVAQIQHLLREQGYYKGEIDGAWGAGTAAAANKYRSQHGLDASDALDIALLRAMNAERSPVPKLAEAATKQSAGVPLQAGPTALRALQKELSSKGFATGDIDGAWGQETQAAVREFQRTHELEATGTLTLPTLAALGVDVAQSRDGSFKAREAARPAEETHPPSVASDQQEPKD